MLTSLVSTLLAPRTTAYAHCDLPCGVYDPAQARLEAESVKACMVKYHGSDDPDFKGRAISIKEERSDLVKHHLWVLWTDYFKAPHFEAYPQLQRPVQPGHEARRRRRHEGHDRRRGRRRPARQDRRDRGHLLGDQEGVADQDTPAPGVHLRVSLPRSPSTCRRGSRVGAASWATIGARADLPLSHGDGHRRPVRPGVVSRPRPTGASALLVGHRVDRLGERGLGRDDRPGRATAHPDRGRCRQR